MEDVRFVLDRYGDLTNEKIGTKSMNIAKTSSAVSQPSKPSHTEQLSNFRDELLRESKQSEQSILLGKHPSLLLNSILSNNEFVHNKPDIGKMEKEKLSSRKQDIKKKSIALEVQKVLQKAIVTPSFEQLKMVPPYEVSKRKLQLEKKKEKEKTKGKNWFGLPATEMTEDIKQNLEILQMRSVLDPKHFYKKNDLKVVPKYFQIGKVMDSSLDFYNSRLTNKERKKTLVDELLCDAEFQKYNKRKYKEIMEEKQKTHYKSWRKAKSLKKKKN